MLQVQVVAVDQRSGVSSAGRPYNISILKCVTNDTSDNSVQVGELVLPADHPEVTPGKYTGRVSIQSDREGRLVGRVVELTPQKT